MTEDICKAVFSILTAESPIIMSISLTCISELGLCGYH